MKFGFLHNRWFKFAIWSLLYLAWVIWLGNYWWLIGEVVIFDLYITKKVKWAFWRKRGNDGKPKAWVEWVDAILFALVAATFIRMFFIEAYTIPTGSMEKTLMVGDYLFVSKLSYGPKVPQTPLSFPLVHNVMPIFGGESYSTAIQNDYRRLKGFGEVKRDDIVVFGFPNGDTVLRALPQDDYYQVVRINDNDREYTRRMYGPVIVRPDDKKDNYVKRCVAIAGDSLSVINGTVYVNGVQQPQYDGIQSTYTVYTNGSSINSKILEEIGLYHDGLYFDSSLPGYPEMTLTKSELKKIEQLPVVVDIRENIDVYPPDYPDSYLTLFPFDEDFRWTRDNYGPIWIPEKGATVELTPDNLPLYQRIIDVYEGNDINVTQDGRIFINGEEAGSYTFRQDYYFMMGDNRHNSLDSRYWGFVPEDHIVGKPAMIWFSSDRNKSFPKNIRWNRLFKFV